jgi:uncharacterized protein YdhG (YjbR/CyaY superfamily)
MTGRYAGIDSFLQDLSPEKRAALERIRGIVRTEVPEAEECINYGVPAFRLHGKALVAFGAGSRHCSFYPMSPDVQASFAGELAGFESSKGTIRFQPDKPIPEDLIRKLLRARISELHKPGAFAGGSDGES